MKVNLAFVSEDDQLLEPHLECDLPCLPQRGDTITILRSEQSGSAKLTVRNIHWVLDHSAESRPHQASKIAPGHLNQVTLECEFVVGSYTSEEHRNFAVNLAK
jgi:hypothetical protein